MIKSKDLGGESMLKQTARLNLAGCYFELNNLILQYEQIGLDNMFLICFFYEYLHKQTPWRYNPLRVLDLEP